MVTNKVAISLTNNTSDIGDGFTTGNHPNGVKKGPKLERPMRDDSPFMEDIFPPTELGRLLRGIHRSYLIKYEPRLGWAHRRACNESALLKYPCESVASHQWGITWLILTISNSERFKKEIPEFNKQVAYEMAASHDVPELVTGDITPADGISAEEKHRMESLAMQSIQSFYPDGVANVIDKTYKRYEERQCIESKFVKDCDRLDFMITAFVLERVGFSGFEEFYANSRRCSFSTKIAGEMAELLVETRNKLDGTDSLYPSRENSLVVKDASLP